MPKNTQVRTDEETMKILEYVKATTGMNYSEATRRAVKEVYGELMKQCE